MKDWKDYHLFRTISLDACKVYSKAPTDMFYDRATLSVFRDVIEVPKPLTKYYFADTIMKRIDEMLGVLKGDYSDMYQGKKEVGTCMCKDGLAFVYTINPNTAKLIVVSGINPQSYVPAVNIEGAVIIDLRAGTRKDVANSLAARAHAYSNHTYTPNKMVLRNIKDFTRKAARTTYVSLESLPSDVKFVMTEHQTRTEALERALRMFMFLKYADGAPRIVEEAEHRPRKETVGELKKRGIILVDANWDSELHVLNPFGVCEHFRNQPYKDEEGKWQKKLIIIAPFIKKGYHRRSTKQLKTQTK